MALATESVTNFLIAVLPPPTTAAVPGQRPASQKQLTVGVTEHSRSRCLGHWCDRMLVCATTQQADLQEQPGKQSEAVTERKAHS